MSATGRTSPTALRWELGARLRALRTHVGLSIEEAAKELMCSQAKVSRMETAGRGIQPRDVRDLCRLYQVPDDVRAELLSMAIEARRPGWWQRYGTLDEQAATFIGLETAASTITTLESRVVPGLLQTPEYARALLDAFVSAEQVEDLVASRQARAERVRQNATTLLALVDEAVFWRTLGHPEVMIDQLRRVLECATWPNVTLQIIPLTARPHPGIHGSFVHLAFGGIDLLEVVVFEGLSGTTFVDRPTDVDNYKRAWESSRQEALTPEKSFKWLSNRLRVLEDPASHH